MSDYPDITAYNDDARVVRHNAGYIYTVNTAGQEFTVHAGEGPPVHEWKVYVDSAGDKVIAVHATAGEAVYRLIGDPR